MADGDVVHAFFLSAIKKKSHAIFRKLDTVGDGHVKLKVSQKDRHHAVFPLWFLDIIWIYKIISIHMT